MIEERPPRAAPHTPSDDPRVETPFHLRPWREQVPAAKLNVADAMYRRRLREASSAQDRSWEAAVDVLVGEFVTNAAHRYLVEVATGMANRRAEEAEEYRQRHAREIADATAAMRAQLRAVHVLLDHRRKTVRMDDLRAALEGLPDGDVKDRTS